jgi:hypothetical protein
MQFLQSEQKNNSCKGLPSKLGQGEFTCKQRRECCAPGTAPLALLLRHKTCNFCILKNNDSCQGLASKLGQLYYRGAPGSHMHVEFTRKDRTEFCATGTAPLALLLQHKAYNYWMLENNNSCKGLPGKLGQLYYEGAPGSHMHAEFTRGERRECCATCVGTCA